MKKRIGIGLVLMIVGASVALLWWHRHRSESSLPEARPVYVKVAQVELRNEPMSIAAVGTLVARKVAVSSEIPGHVKSIAFKDGGNVAAGSLLIALDDGSYIAQKDAILATLKYNQGVYQRSALLLKKGAVSRAQMDHAASLYRESQAQLEKAQIHLQQTNLLAPFAGTMGQSKVNVGDYVTVGEPLVTITETQNLRVEYSVSEKYLPQLALGQRVLISTEAYPHRSFEGRVAYISPGIDAANRSINVYAVLPNPDGVLRDGMFVHVQQILPQQHQACFVPEKAIVPVLDGDQVYKVVEGRAYAVQVSLGMRLKNLVEVQSGLKAGDMIITDGQLKVKNGLQVQIAANSQ